MIKRLAVAALGCLWVAGAYAMPGDQTTPSYVKPGPVLPIPNSFCQLSVGSTVVALSTCTSGIPFGATYALVTNEGAAIRWRDDGVPTASLGQIIGTGTATSPVVVGFTTTLSTVQLIAESGTGMLDISFYK